MNKIILGFGILICLSLSSFASFYGKIQKMDFIGPSDIYGHTDKVQVFLGAGNGSTDGFSAVYAQDKHLVAALILAYQNDRSVRIGFSSTEKYYDQRPRIISISFE